MSGGWEAAEQELQRHAMRMRRKGNTRTWRENVCRTAGDDDSWQAPRDEQNHDQICTGGRGSVSRTFEARPDRGTRRRTLSMLSQDPVHKAMPSALTPRQLTRFSCPASTPTRSPLSVSQTLTLKSS